MGTHVRSSIYAMARFSCICLMNDFWKVYFYFQDKEVGDPIRTFRVCDNDSTITHIDAEVSVSLLIVVHPIHTNC